MLDVDLLLPYEEEFHIDEELATHIQGYDFQINRFQQNSNGRGQEPRNPDLAAVESRQGRF